LIDAGIGDRKGDQDNVDEDADEEQYRRQTPVPRFPHRRGRQLRPNLHRHCRRRRLDYARARLYSGRRGTQRDLGQTSACNARKLRIYEDELWADRLQLVHPWNRSGDGGRLRDSHRRPCRGARSILLPARNDRSSRAGCPVPIANPCGEERVMKTMAESSYRAKANGSSSSGLAWASAYAGPCSTPISYRSS
jgi:hypothetical protein